MPLRQVGMWLKGDCTSFFQMWTSVKETTAASMAARTSSGATGAAARRATSSTTSGTSVLASTFPSEQEELL